MAILSGNRKKWWIILIALVTGSLAGIYLRRFDILEPYFRTFFSPGFSLDELDLVFASFSISFHFHCNLGTIIGGVLGIWITL